MTALYEKRGRRYQFWGSTDQWFDGDLLKAGDFRITYHDGEMRRYEYLKGPELVKVEAAIMVARAAMERAIAQRVKAVPDAKPVPYTLEQVALIEKFRADMAAVGGLVPDWWTHATASDVVDAALQALRESMSNE